MQSERCIALHHLGLSHFFCLWLWQTRALIVYSLTLRRLRAKKTREPGTVNIHEAVSIAPFIWNSNWVHGESKREKVFSPKKSKWSGVEGNVTEVSSWGWGFGRTSHQSLTPQISFFASSNFSLPSPRRFIRNWTSTGIAETSSADVETC